MGQKTPPHLCLSPGLLKNGCEGVKTIRQASDLLHIATANFFLWDSEIRASKPITVPGQPQGKLRGGWPDQQKRVGHLLLG